MSILVNKDDNPRASWLTILFTLIKFTLKMLQLLRAVMLRVYVKL